MDPHANTMLSSSAAMLPDSLGAGRYEIRCLVGEGSEKRVYLAHDTRLERDVAIGVFKTHGLDEAALARIRREARAMAKLGDHPNVVDVYDVGEADGQPYIVSQYMAGGAVDQHLKTAEGGRLPLEQTLRIAAQVCSALEHAHDHGVIHRDLKPSNVWLAWDGTAKLGDFGLATMARGSFSGDGSMVGTFYYMPPEQAFGRPADSRNDLYSLGAMLYEMVTGRPPFLGDDAVSIISQHVYTPPVAPSWHCPQVPRELDALILRLLAKAPEDRPERASTVRQALLAIASAPASSGAGEHANPLDRLAGGVFVGRERELRELRAVLDDVFAHPAGRPRFGGRGWLILLAGEPGIGKTRTAEEFVVYARLRKAQVLWGRCHEGEGAPAYWPWIQAIRSWVQHRDTKTLRGEMGPGAADIAQVVPEIRERMPDLPNPPTLESEHARFRLFDSIATFLRNAARVDPIVVVLDDLHWADKPSLLLLEFVALELGKAPLLVLGTYRDVEVGRKHPLAQTLGELAREQLSRRIFLRGLTEGDVGHFIEISAGLKPPSQLVSTVHRETEGNPFFVNEVVRLLLSEGRLEQPTETTSWSLDIPQSIREVIGSRLDRLSPACNGALTVAAVVGQEFGIDVLEQVSDLTGDALLDALDEAVAARAVAEVPRIPGRYSFSHVLVRETLYGELTVARRARLHRRIAGALEALHRRHPDPHLVELAYHSFHAALGGGDVDRAVDYARRAGDQATALLAHEDAVRHYAQALEALELKEPSDETRRCEILLELGHAQARAGDTAAAQDTFLRAIEPARRTGDGERLARAALGFGQIGPVLGRSPGKVDDVLVGLLEEALRLLPPDDSTLRARLLGRLAVALYWSPTSERRESLSGEAVDMAARIGDPATRATVLGMRHTAIYGPGNAEGRLAIASEVLRWAEEAGDQEAVLEAHRRRLTDLLELGDIGAVDREIEVYDDLARTIRQPLHIGFTAAFRAMRALVAGRFAEAETFTETALSVGQRFGNRVKVVLSAQMLWLRREQGRLQELQAFMGDVLEQASAQLATQAGYVLTLCDFGLAQQAHQEFEKLAANAFTDLPCDFAWLPGIAMLVEICAYLGDARRAALLYDLLLPHADRHITVATGTSYLGPARHYLGLLAATMGSHDAARAHFESALATSAAIGARPFVAHTQRAYAATLLALGAPDRATAMLDQALATAQELGMTMLADRALSDRRRAAEGAS